MDQTNQKQLIEALTQVALLESKEISVGFAEIIAHLQKQEHLAALGAFAGLEEQLKFIDTVLKAAARISQK
jgi:pheromone shutdown protein TraB